MVHAGAQHMLLGGPKAEIRGAMSKSGSWAAKALVMRVGPLDLGEMGDRKTRPQTWG